MKRWLQSQGVYAIGTPKQKMTAEPVGYYEKRWGGGIYVQAGLPDMHICIKGHSLEVELKADKGRASEIQIRNIQQINDAGGCGMIIYPKDFEEFKEKVRGLINNGCN